jgi:hypothetical protein
MLLLAALCAITALLVDAHWALPAAWSAIVWLVLSVPRAAPGHVSCATQVACGGFVDLGDQPDTCRTEAKPPGTADR